MQCDLKTLNSRINYQRVNNPTAKSSLVDHCFQISVIFYD